MIYLLTAIGLTPGGSSTVHIYTQTIHRTTQNKRYIEQHKYFGRVRAVPRLCELFPGTCLTTEETARKKPQSGKPKSAIWHDEDKINVLLLLLQSALQPLVGFRPAQLSLSILSRKVLQSAVVSGTSNPRDL
jgi:hypothetical protein